ncbi:mycofactocin system transcriptional regulator [Leucobacter weissii]|uniref:Mycofactocin system transcriptional regulator n=1 Tax=Leucobacter weissii TaxID=1983706 RepID=A0A939MQE5_9MICO|nr:mycofactocin system transcriptional regulator [Leucobacter weissii]MBO1902797.1 mycofactocin system transcriptional regulator [Leucobacter weissii]
MSDSPGSSPRIGRTPATTHGELSHVALTLFLERGFDNTTVEEVAAAAGISRRTLFRYFASKNDLPWGDFDHLLETMRAHLSDIDRRRPLAEALRQAIIDFNRYPEHELPFHRGRMNLLLNVPSLTAHSTLRYAAWRQVIAEYVGERRGEHVDALTPQAVAWACLGLCLSAYEQWLAHEDQDLIVLLESAFSTAESVFGALSGEP